MIKRNVTAIALLIIGMALINASCAKKGCTDANATNYSEDAKKDDESCRYEGSTVIWIHDSSAQKMIADSIQSLVVYVDGNVEGSLSVSQFFSSPPACNQAGALTVTRDLFSSKTRAISYRVLDNNSVKRWAGVLTFNGNTCEQVELVYFP
jgi:hypothetical protein